MTWRFRRREHRLAQRDADRLDVLLSTARDAGFDLTQPPSADAIRFGPELAAAQAVASSIPLPTEPPESSRVALRAGLAVRRARARRPVGRAAFGLAGMVATAVAVLVLAVSSGSTDRPITVQAQQSIDTLNVRVKDLEAAISTGDKTLISEKAAAAQVAARQATDQVAALPQPSRGIALKVTTQQVETIQWLVTTNHVAIAGTTGSTTTTAPPTSTTAASGSGAGGPTTTTPRRSTTTTTPHETTTSSTSSTSTPGSTSTTAVSPTTTEAPTTTVPPPPASTTTSAPQTPTTVRSPGW